ncbi:hypothetical protein [Streptomyces sp. NPDC001389]|uniref:hypothetical protein n=1 Tax=Streptomyces sp. NPDC001389 TaxID=3364569 RepID=UPI0036A06AB3
MLTEIDKLLAVRAIGLPADLFADVAPKVVAGWRARAAVESPSHLRTHPLRMTLLAALLHEREREREITDTLVELLISTVHRIGARAAWPLASTSLGPECPDRAPKPKPTRALRHGVTPTRDQVTVRHSSALPGMTTGRPAAQTEHRPIPNKPALLGIVRPQQELPTPRQAAKRDHNP